MEFAEFGVCVEHDGIVGIHTSLASKLRARSDAPTHTRQNGPKFASVLCGVAISVRFAYQFNMTVAEVIEEIKRLPPEGQREIKQFVEGWNPEAPVKYIPRDECRAATKEVLKEYDSLFKKLAQ